jgi:hypothetical protein
LRQCTSFSCIDAPVAWAVAYIYELVAIFKQHSIMIQKPDIDKKITEQKTELLKRLVTETKLPITDIQKDSFDDSTFEGQFAFTVDSKKKQLLDFKYENNKFSWDIQKIESDLNSLWGTVFTDNQDTIKQKIDTDLNLSTKDPNTVSIGQIYIVYVYEENVQTPTAIVCEFDNEVWTVKKR